MLKHVVSSASGARHRCKKSRECEETLRYQKQMTIPNASSCTRLLTPSFSLYRFVVSRRNIFTPFFSNGPTNQSQAGPTCDVDNQFSVPVLAFPARGGLYAAQHWHSSLRLWQLPITAAVAIALIVVLVQARGMDKTPPSRRLAASRWAWRQRVGQDLLAVLARLGGRHEG